MKIRRWPGAIAAGAMIALTTFWTYWGAGEMYHEGWWGAWYHRLPYLAPLAITLIPTLIALTWPLAGGVLLLGVAVGLVILFGLDNPLLGGAMGVIGALFVVDGLLRRRAMPSSVPASWWRRHLRYLLAAGLPLIVLIAVSAARLPVVLTRIDDGKRGARLIAGNGVALIWAPKGPGWNWRQEWGGYPSWQSLALYGLPPVGLEDKAGYGWRQKRFAGAQEMAAYNLCHHLSADGMTLLDEPQDIWRLPTTDELVRSLVRHGENAGCAWDGALRVPASCDRQPDKESPLWATDEPAIYYWTADSYSEDRGYFVSYNGVVNATLKTGGNPRHSYRCVRQP